MEHKLFVWEENNICYKSPDKIYNNVLLNTGTVVKGTIRKSNLYNKN